MDAEIFGSICGSFLSKVPSHYVWMVSNTRLYNGVEYNTSLFEKQEIDKKYLTKVDFVNSIPCELFKEATKRGNYAEYE